MANFHSQMRALVLLSAACFTALSQTAQLTGTVVDTSGSVIPAVRVQATNLDTHVVRESVTNEAGKYLVTSLLPGNYEVIAEKTGFKQIRRGPVILAVDQIGGIDFTMEVGAIQESVTVEASGVLLDMASSTVASVVENKQVTELPLNGRSPMDLVALAPGIRVQGTFGGRLAMSGTPGGAWMDFSFNGGMAGAIPFWWKDWHWKWRR